MDIIDLPKPLEFEWNEANQNKIRLRHHITPQEAEQPFYNLNYIFFDEKHSIAERRYQILGATNLGRVLFVVFTIRGRKIRIISARSANIKERSNYAKKTKENS